MRILGLAAAAMLGVVALAHNASAGTVTTTVTFSATNFVAESFGGGPAPVDPVSGSFSFTYDPSQSYSDSTDIVKNLLNINLGSTLAFNYDPVAKRVTIGGELAGVTGVQFGSNDIYLRVDLFPGGIAPYAGYSQASVLDAFFTHDVTYTVATVAATPVPSSLLMLMTAFAGVGGASLLRKSRAGAAAA